MLSSYTLLNFSSKTILNPRFISKRGLLKHVTRKSAEQQELQNRARNLTQAQIAPRVQEIEETGQYPHDIASALAREGMMGITLVKEYGGLGRSYLDAAIAVEEVSKVSALAGRIVVEANMGAISAIMSYGSHEQKKLASQLILDGDKPAICITEPDAGSAALDLQTSAYENEDGSYRLNGRKVWISGGGVSKLNLIFARVFDIHQVEQGIGGFIVINDPSNPKLSEQLQGFKVERLENTLGLRGMPEAEIHIDNLIVPSKDVLKTPNGFTRGFADLMSAYNAQRVGAAACALGVAQGAYETALNYSKERHQFGRPICEFQGIQWMLADMSIQLEAARNLVYKAAASAGDDWEIGVFPDVLLAAQAKIFSSEMAIKVTNDALQIFGAAGYSKRCPVERFVRDARMFTIGGGTAQVLRNVVASKILHRKFPQTK